MTQSPTQEQKIIWIKIRGNEKSSHVIGSVNERSCVYDGPDS